MTINLPGYFNRFDEDKRYTDILFRVGYLLQGAELNEVLSTVNNRARRVSDGLYQDGDILRGATISSQISQDEMSYAVALSDGLIYLGGIIHSVPAGNVTVPATGKYDIGVYLLSEVVTEVQDATLRDPAIGLKTYGEPGAARLKMTPSWGLGGNAALGDFYPIYHISDGVVFSRSAPPEVSAINQAITRYDVQSTGGLYAVSGLKVSLRPDDPGGHQQYLVSAGQARINGLEVNLQHDRLASFTVAADVREVLAEIYTSTGATGQRIDLRHTPVAGVSQVRVTREVTSTITHGGFTGAVDPLPNTSVTQVLEVKQGATTYTVTTDYLVSGDSIDWSPGGAEPATGSTYTVKYRYISLESVTPDSTGFVISGQTVSGSNIEVTYTWKLPRIDRIALNQMGEVVLIKGVSATAPKYPDIPVNHLGIASVNQTWTNARTVANDGFRVVPMWQIEGYSKKLDTLFAAVSTLELKVDAGVREPLARRGIFADAFMDQWLRDAGVAQTATVFDGELTLGMTATVYPMNLGDDIITLDHTDTRIIAQQTLSSGSRKINPYQVFEPLPSIVELDPWNDYWNESIQNDLPVETHYFLGAGVTGTGAPQEVRMAVWSDWNNVTGDFTDRTETVTTTIDRFARPNTVRFRVDFFGAGEIVTDVQIDGVSLTFGAQP